METLVCGEGMQAMHPHRLICRIQFHRYISHARFPVVPVENGHRSAWSMYMVHTEYPVIRISMTWRWNEFGSCGLWTITALCRCVVKHRVPTPTTTTTHTHAGRGRGRHSRQSHPECGLICDLGNWPTPPAEVRYLDRDRNPCGCECTR